MRLARLSGVTLALLGFASVAYPFLVYFGISHYGPATFAGLLFIILFLRFIFAKQYKEPTQWALLIVVSLFCTITVFINSLDLLRYYPVVMSTGFMIIFLYSLSSDTPLIEKFARAAGENPTPFAKRWARNLTKAWIVILLVNAIIAGYTACCLSLEAWTLYNGLLSYILFASFFTFEYIIRKRFAHKFY